ncbi:hypothetical protein [Myroides odoratus]|uniref:hypothetical protein n=1 Tax=Myroides odoratus TaxID=256 RepID=UPI0007658570|nr:hypothetical protein [Myroides odoratus]
MKNEITKNNFPELRSVPNWFLTWLNRIFIVVIFGLLFIAFYAIPILFHVDGTVNAEEISIFSLFYYPLIIWLSYLGLRHFKKSLRNTIAHIIVNKEGVSYIKSNGSVELISYKQLSRSNNSAVIVWDVFTKKLNRYGPMELKVFCDGQPKTVYFSTHVYNYYSGNRHLLRRHFIQGIKLFRPDLNIAPYVYSEFYINPKTFEYNKKSHLKVIILSTLFLILILIAIDLYMQCRFGESLLFDFL